MPKTFLLNHGMRVILYRCWWYTLLLGVCLALEPASVAAQEPATRPSREAVLGRAGDLVISEEEFVRRFEFSPGFQRQKKGRLEEQKRMVLYSLVAEKLLAQEAESRGVSRDSSFREGMEGLRRILARDELYRQEIAGKVTVSDREVAEGLRRCIRTVFVQYLYSEREDDARFVAGQLTKTPDLSALTVDSSLAVARDTVTVVWGEADPALEDAAFTVKPGQVSGVVRAKNGFYVVAPLKIYSNAFYAGMQPDVRRERVIAALRLRKESARLDEYMRELLAGKVGYAKGPLLHKLAVAFCGLLTRQPGDSLYELPSTAQTRLQVDLEPVLDDTFMVAGNAYWTVRQVIGRFVEAGFRIPVAEPLLVAGKINAQSRIWVQQDLLEQEAMRLALDKKPEVQQQLEEWKQAYLAQLMRGRIEGGVTVSEPQVYAYMEQNNLPLRVPEVRIRELRAGSLDELQEPLKELANHVPFDAVVRRWSSDPAARMRGGMSDFFRITERPPIGEIAAAMKVGEIAGPLLEGDTLLVFQLAERRQPGGADSAARATFAEKKHELLQLLRKHTLDRFIATSAGKRGVVVYEDRLPALNVSPVPMVAFRVIGFGGRMFAAPLLVPLYEWTTVRGTDQPLLP